MTIKDFGSIAGPASDSTIIINRPACKICMELINRNEVVRLLTD